MSTVAAAIVAGKKSPDPNSPVVKIRTRVHCSYMSTDKKIQSALMQQPPPLGRLATSVLAVALKDIERY